MDNPKEPAQVLDLTKPIRDAADAFRNSREFWSSPTMAAVFDRLASDVHEAIAAWNRRASPAPGQIGEEPPGSGWVPTQPQRFLVGQPVEIATTYRYHADWHGQHLWIAGVQRFDRDKELNYAITEHWPPRHPGDITDGFTEADLSPLPTPPAKAE